MRWISRSLRAAPPPTREELDAGDRHVALHRRRQCRLGHAGQPRVLGLRGRIDGARPLRIVGDFRGELGQDDVAARKVEGGGRADRTGPVDESRTIGRHDHVAGVEVGMAQPVLRPQALDQGEDARRDVLRNTTAGELQRSQPVAQRETSGGGGVL